MAVYLSEISKFPITNDKTMYIKILTKVLNCCIFSLDNNVECVEKLQ